jgi:YaiO family outer membrane protein
MLILILAFASASFSASLSYEQGVSKVRKLIAVKKHVEAERLLTAMLKEYPGNPEILSIRGRVRLWMGETSSAEKDFRRSLLHRDDRGVRAELARIETRERLDRAATLLAKGDLSGAERLLEKLFTLGLDRYSAGLMLARLHTSSGAHPKATAIYRLLHREFPLDHDITLLYIRGLVRAGETVRAEEEMALLPNKEHPSLHLARAVALVSRKQYDQALDHYKRSLHLRDDPDVRAEMRSVESLLAFQKADESMAAGNPGEAERLLRLHFEEGAARYEAGHRLARLLIARKAFDEALAVYLALAEEHPADTDVLTACLDTFLLAGNVEAAWTILSLIQSDVSQEVQIRRARVLYRLGRFPRSAVEFRRAIEHGAEPSLTGELAAAERAAALRKAEQLYKEGRVDEAERIWRDLFDSGRERYESGLCLVRLYRDRREFAQAASILEKLRGFYPADTDITLTHLDTMLADGRLADAERELAALPLEGSPQFTLRRARLMYRLGRFDDAGNHFTILSREFPSDPGLYALAIESRLLSRDTATAGDMVSEASRERMVYLQRERQDLLYRIRPNSLKVSGLVAAYDNGIPTGREMSVSLSQRISPASIELHASSVNRYGQDDSEIGGEVAFPFTANGKLRGAFAASFSPAAQFLPRTTFRGEVTQALGNCELSLGYSRMNFSENSTDILIFGFLGYLAHALRLSERLYTVPERGSLSLLSTLHFEPHHRLNAFYSFGLGNASENLREKGSLKRYFTLSNRIGAEYRPLAAISVGADIFHEYRDTLYSRFGIEFFTRYWW